MVNASYSAGVTEVAEIGEHHESAVKSHCSAAESHGKNDHVRGKEHATQDELQILAMGAIDGDGEYCVQRDLNKPWGADYADMKNPEHLG